MKRLMILLPALLLLCGGCSLWKDAPPLEATESVQTLGVDLDDGVLVSVSTGSEDDAERISETGETLRTALDALRDRSKHGGLFYGHTQYLLLGEDFARAGVQELTDFTARSAELRLAACPESLRLRPCDPLIRIRRVSEMHKAIQPDYFIEPSGCVTDAVCQHVAAGCRRNLRYAAWRGAGPGHGAHLDGWRL